MLHTKDTMEFEQKSGKSKVVSNLLGHFNFFKWHHVICFDLPSKVQLSPHHQDKIKRRPVSSSSSSSSSSKVQVILHRDSTSDKEALQARIIQRCHNKLHRIIAVMFCLIMDQSFNFITLGLIFFGS